MNIYTHKNKDFEKIIGSVLFFPRVSLLALFWAQKERESAEMERQSLFKDKNELNFHFSAGERVTATESQFFFLNHYSLDPFLS